MIAMGVEPDGFNINQGVGSTDTAALSQRVLAESADLGIALDGDGDRVIFVDGRGEVVDGDELLYIIARHRGCEGVVGTLMTNLGVEIALREGGIGFARAQVGDRYVNRLMREKGWPLGGESSGHIISADLTTTGDGIIAALQVLVAVQDSGNTLAELCAGVEKYPQHIINVRIPGPVAADAGAGLSADTSLGTNGANWDAGPDSNPGPNPSANPETNPEIAAAVAEAESALGDAGRVLLRPSGTEPVVRVMVEGRDPQQVQDLCQQLAGKVEKALAGGRMSPTPIHEGPDTPVASPPHTR